jgi:hypothetical protein
MQIPSITGETHRPKKATKMTLFIVSWKSMLADRDLQAENIDKCIQPGLAIADKYYDKMGDTNAYIIAMCESTSSFYLA